MQEAAPNEAEPTGNVSGDWEEFRRTADGKLYYYNEKTNQTEWVKPAGFGGSAPPPPAKAAPASPNKFAAGATSSQYRADTTNDTTNTTPYSREVYYLNWFSGLVVLFWTVIHLYLSFTKPEIAPLVFAGPTINPSNTFGAQVPALVGIILLIRWSDRRASLRAHVFTAIVSWIWSLYWFVQPIRFILRNLSSNSSEHLDKDACDSTDDVKTACALIQSYDAASIVCFAAQFFWMIYAVRTAYVSYGNNRAPTIGYDALGKPLLGMIAFALLGYLIWVCAAIADNTTYNKDTKSLYGTGDVTLLGVSPIYCLSLGISLGLLAYNILGASHLQGTTVAIVGVTSAIFWGLYSIHATRTAKYWSSLSSQCGGTTSGVTAPSTDGCGAQRAQAAGIGLICIALLLIMLSFAAAKFKGWK